MLWWLWSAQSDGHEGLQGLQGLSGLRETKGPKGAPKGGPKGPIGSEASLEQHPSEQASDDADPQQAQQAHLARLFDAVHPRERQFYLLPDVSIESHNEFPSLAHIPSNPPQISVVEPSELAKSDIPEVRRLALRGEPMIQVVQTKGPFVVAVPLNPVNSPAQALLPGVAPVNPMSGLVPQQAQQGQQGQQAPQPQHQVCGAPGRRGLPEQ